MSNKAVGRFVIHDIETVSMGSDAEENSNASKPRFNRVVIPVIPKPLAIFCLVSNVVLPGSGTIVAGFSVFCFHYKKESFLRAVSISVSNVVIGLCQLITVMFLLIGWIWSIIWGCALVGHASHYNKNQVDASPSSVRLSKAPPTVS